MSIWAITGIVAIAGGIGGVVAALLSEDRGFVLPKGVEAGGSKILRPGFVGLILTGAIAAALSFALYGPLASSTVVGGPENADEEVVGDDDSGADFGITLAALGGAVLVGAGGSKWLSSQVDKATVQAAASIAAGKDASAEKSAEIAKASPLQALRIAQAM